VLHDLAVSLKERAGSEGGYRRQFKVSQAFLAYFYFYFLIWGESMVRILNIRTESRRWR